MASVLEIQRVLLDEVVASLMVGQDSHEGNIVCHHVSVLLCVFCLDVVEPLVYVSGGFREVLGGAFLPFSPSSVVEFAPCDWFRSA